MLTGGLSSEQRHTYANAATAQISTIKPSTTMAVLIMIYLYINVLVKCDPQNSALKHQLVQ